MSNGRRRVAVLGAAGRMGRQAVEAVSAAQDLELVASLGRGDALSALVEARAEIVVELTVPGSTRDNLAFLVDHGMHAVVGTTGWDEEALSSLRSRLESHPEVGVLIAPNFSIGAVLAMRFAAMAAPFFESSEIIELHHPEKLDAPSGTAVHTAAQIAGARAAAGLGPSPDATAKALDGARGACVDGVRVHSVRLRGLVAHEEILFGSPGEQLTIRTDSFSRESFMPGVLTGIRKVAQTPGLTVGLEHYLGLAGGPEASAGATT